MNKIFLWCVPTHSGGRMVNGSTVSGNVIGYALAEDGTGLCSHLSSNEDFSKHDMGLTSNWKHDIYQEHYPDGYELEWVTNFHHPGFEQAFKLNQGKYIKAGGDYEEV